MRTNRLFWGGLLALAGLVLLAQNFGLIDPGFWKYIGAILLILIGVWIIVRPRLAKEELAAETITLPLEGLTEVKVEIEHGAGRLVIGSLATPGELLAGSFTGGLQHELDVTQQPPRLKLRPPSDSWSIPVGIGSTGLNWEMGLSREIPLHLDIKSGAGETEMDLTELQVRNLEIGTGASSTHVTLPAHAGYTRVKIGAGMASVRIRIPEGVEARVQMDTGLSSHTISPARFTQRGDKVYETAQYETGLNRVDIEVEAGLGSFEII